MSQQDLRLHSAAYSGLSDTHIPIDALIWTGLRRAFPLPTEGRDDESFGLLLNAMTLRHGPASRQPSASFAGASS